MQKNFLSPPVYYLIFKKTSTFKFITLRPHILFIEYNCVKNTFSTDLVTLFYIHISIYTPLPQLNERGSQKKKNILPNFLQEVILFRITIKQNRMNTQWNEFSTPYKSVLSIYIRSKVIGISPKLIPLNNLTISPSLY